jgi:hypothetical protein
MAFVRGLAGQRWSRVVLAALASVLALVLMSQGSTALAWGGKGSAQSKSSVSPATCSPSSSSVAGGDVATIYYVTATAGVNVRQGPGTSYCVIATQSYQADVVQVPGVSTVNANGYTWMKVAYFQGQCRYCTNYSWSHTGWIATSNLTVASDRFTCLVSSGCDLYRGGVFGYGWQFGGPYPPTNPQFTQSQCQNYSNPDNACLWEGYQQTVVEGNGYGADTTNPNWFGTSSGPNWYTNFVWNYDWWAH